MQALFDHCDDRVDHAERTGRKGWLAAYRDAVLFRTMYAWGLRRREAAMLDVTDWGPNRQAPRFGAFGVLNVRYGKASRGSPPRQRSVLTAMGWAADTMAEWVGEIRPAYGVGAARMLWPTDRGGRVATGAINARFAAYRDAIGLDPALTPHCLRHSFISHQLEDCVDQLFVQQQDQTPVGVLDHRLHQGGQRLPAGGPAPGPRARLRRRRPGRGAVRRTTP